MRLDIGEKHVIKSDGRCISLFKKLISKKDKKEYIEEIGHYPNLKSCLDRLVEEKISQVEVNSIDELILKIDEIKSEILESLQNLNLK